jgi:acyl-CoA reductase-like NAD-dependent aldehyde dehydrogenase
MNVDEHKLAEIVEAVIARLGPITTSRGHVLNSKNSVTCPPISKPGREIKIPRGTLGVYPDPESAVLAAQRGFRQLERVPLETRAKMIAAMRAVAEKHVRELSEYAVLESGLGRADDKIVKNRLAIAKTPGLEVLRPMAVTGDDGLMLTERAPYGVILAVTPCTNPTETILCNGIGMLAAGNAVVFNVHPSAAQVSNWLVHLLNEAIVAAGGPKDIITSIERPTIESAQALFQHSAFRLVVVTGGGAVVKAAMASAKKCIAAGPGNPPVVVDETAQIGRAAKAIVKGASVDNNIICTAEKEVIAVDSIAGSLQAELEKNGCLVLNPAQIRALEKVIIVDGHVNRDFVGKNAAVIAESIGIRGHGPELRLLLCPVEESHPFIQHELLMPVLGMMRVPSCEDGIAAAVRVEHGFRHTFVMHSAQVERLAAMARVCDASIFVKNDCNLAGLGLGGEGHTSFTIASPTGEGLTTAVHFSRERRCTLKEAFRFV